MHFSPFIISVSLLAALASCTPATLYRGDSSSPTAAHAAGGLKAKGYGRSDAVTANQENLFKHVSKQWGKVSPMKDPFISTSDKKAVAQGSAATSSTYVYTIDSSKVTNKIWSCATEYAQAEKKYPHSEECEFAVEGIIPWAAITNCEKKNNGVWENVALPSKRELPVEDVFWA